MHLEFVSCILFFALTRDMSEDKLMNISLLSENIHSLLLS